MERDSQSRVRALFENLAPKYDLGNDLLSLGTHRLYKRISLASLDLKKGDSFIDLCTGTGDLAIAAYSKVGSSGHVVGVDFSMQMLEVARKRALAQNASIDFIEGNVTSLSFEDGRFDAASIAFGLRNIDDKEKVFKEAYRVLKRKGSLMVLEFSNPEDSFFPWLYKFYLDLLVPTLGKIVSQDGNAYRYLSGSIHDFPRIEEVLAIATKAGFTATTRRFLGGALCLYNCMKV